jgi:phosphatidylglycerophosphate synthase
MNWRLFLTQVSDAIPSSSQASFVEVAASFGVLTLVVAAYWSHGIVHNNAPPSSYARLAKERGGVLFRKSLMNVGYWLLQPIGRTLHARRVAPNTITLAGLVLAVAAAVAIIFGRLGLAGVALLGAALCDALDGMVARLANGSSQSGAALDAIVDRIQEIFVFSAIAISARAVPWVAALSVFAMVASLMNSYISAKAEVFRIEIPNGKMRRGERAAWVMLGCLLVPLAELFSPFTHVGLGSAPLAICLCVIAMGTAVSASIRAIALVELLKARATAANGQDGRAEDSNSGSTFNPTTVNASSSWVPKPRSQAAIYLVAGAGKGK